MNKHNTVSALLFLSPHIESYNNETNNRDPEDHYTEPYHTLNYHHPTTDYHYTITPNHRQNHGAIYRRLLF